MSGNPQSVSGYNHRTSGGTKNILLGPKLLGSFGLPPVVTGKNENEYERSSQCVDAEIALRRVVGMRQNVIVADF